MPQKVTIYFNEELHRYTDEYLTEYTSVTTLINKYKPKFDTDKFALIDANKIGVSKETIIKKWETDTKEACDKGTIVHKYLEDNINLLKKPGKGFNNRSYKYKVTTLEELDKTTLRKTHTAIYYRLSEFIVQGATIFAEKRVYSFEYQIAGTIDLFVLFPDNSFYILDWKTNKHPLRFDAGYFKKKWAGNVKIETGIWVPTYKYLYEPISHLPNSKGVIYTLQLSLYALLAEMWGCTCKGLELYHMENEIKVNSKVVPYRISYLKNEAQAMLDYESLRLYK